MNSHTVQDETRIETAVRALEAAFGVCISLHDLRGTIRHPDGAVLLARRHLHRHPCCLGGRYAVPGWDDACYRDCFTVSETAAVEAGRPFVKKCWKGLGELVVPIFRGENHVLTIYAGVFRVPDAEPDLSAADAETATAFHSGFEALPLLDEAALAPLGEVLTLFGEGMIERVCRRDGEAADDVSRGAAIRRYIRDRAHCRITLPDLARHLHLSPSRASHAVREYTGMAFQDLLRNERMLRARNLLLLSEGGLEEIAARLGFRNGCYFSRVFTRFYGLPPGEYRRRHGMKDGG